MKRPVTLPTETMTFLESPGITVESAFVNDGAKRPTVIVHRVVLNGGSSPEKPPAVVKLSERQYALPYSHNIQLATPQYYRKYHGEDLGIRDERESSYVRRMDLKQFLDTHNSRLSDFGLQPGMGSVELTFAHDDCWIFCTSVKPTTARRLRRRFSEDYDSATVIYDPSEFARELGATFESHIEDVDLRPSDLDIVAGYTLPSELREMTVWVYHGQVVYLDDPSVIIESYPEEKHAIILPFLKRSKYAYQREYRFVVATHGKPVKKVLRLPVSDDLRGLTEAWEL